MKVVVPPIKSQGIKTKLVPWIIGQVPTADLQWVEPFMGTGVVGFNSGFKKAIMADANPHLIRFYEAVKNDEITAELVRDYLLREGALLASAPDNGYEHYRFIRARFNAGGNPLDFLFLNRAGFNGMIRFSKKSGWNIPFCKKPERFVGALVTKIVNQVARVRNIMGPGWKFLHSDFRAVIEASDRDAIIYCDPPYHGRHTDYYSSWSDADEAHLAMLLKATRAKFILSTWHHNDFRVNESLRKHWDGFYVTTREHFYHAGAKERNRRPMIEALVMNFEPHTVPEVEIELDEGDGQVIVGRSKPTDIQIPLSI